MAATGLRRLGGYELYEWEAVGCDTYQVESGGAGRLVVGGRGGGGRRGRRGRRERRRDWWWVDKWNQRRING